MIDFIQNCIDGMMFGSSYALLAIGFTLIFGVMRRLNLSFGPSIMLGAFLGTWLHINMNAPVWVVALTTIAGAVAVGIYVERLCFWAIRKDAAIASMVSSFAIWMQLEEASIHLLPERTYSFPALSNLDNLALGPFSFRSEYLSMFSIALVLVATLHFILYRTTFGLKLRAVSENPDAVNYLGINTNRVMFLAFALVSLIGGTAGFLILATDQQITPFFGLWATFKGLIAMMLGGLGSLPGAIIGGLLLGVVEAQTLWYLGSEYKDMSAYLVLFVLLIVRPGGIMGQARFERDRMTFRRV